MLTIRHPYNEQQVVDLLRQHNPSKKQTEQASKNKWNQYISLVTQAIHKSVILARDSQIEDNSLPMEWEKMYDALGKNRNFVYLNWFHKHFPLVHIIRKGTPGTLTMTKLLFEIDTLPHQDDTTLLQAASVSATAQDAFLLMFKEHSDTLVKWIDSGGTNSLVDLVPVDLRSLEANLLSNQAAQLTASPALLKTLQMNFIKAKTIFLCAQHWYNFTGQAALPQIASESDFGRRYYRSLNLQSCPKIIRHAALGDCHQYDLHASVFAWKYATVKRIDPTVKLTYTLEYLDFKDSIRRMLAKDLAIAVSQDQKIKIVKEFISAIGFGAQAKSNGGSWVDSNGSRKFPALNDIIRSPEARQRLLNTAWLKNFVKEQNLINKIIFDHYEESLGHLPFLKDKDTGQLKKQKLISYVYQTDERATIEQLAQSARDNGTFLLMVHDGFYTSQPIKLSQVREKLQTINPIADITKEFHKGYAFEDSQQHKKLILQQELKANNGVIPANVIANRNRINKLNKKSFDYTGSDELDNGNRLTSEYDIELDPFYME
jgi:hypothetical protein